MGVLRPQLGHYEEAAPCIEGGFFLLLQSIMSRGLLDCISLNAHTAEFGCEGVRVRGLDKAPSNVFLLVAALPATLPAFNAAQAVKVVHGEKRVAKPPDGNGTSTMWGKSRSFMRAVISPLRRVTSFCPGLREVRLGRLARQVCSVEKVEQAQQDRQDPDLEVAAAACASHGAANKTIHHCVRSSDIRKQPSKRASRDRP